MTKVLVCLGASVCPTKMTVLLTSLTGTDLCVPRLYTFPGRPLDVREPHQSKRPLRLEYHSNEVAIPWQPYSSTLASYLGPPLRHLPQEVHGPPIARPHDKHWRWLRVFD